MATSVGFEKVWLEKRKYEEAEKGFYERRGDVGSNVDTHKACSKEAKCGKKGKNKQLDAGNTNAEETKQGAESCIVSEIARCRKQILLSLNGPQAGDNAGHLLSSRLENLELENKDLKKTVSELQSLVRKLESRVTVLEATKPQSQTLAKAEKPAPQQVAKVQNGEKKAADDDDDDLDLFGSDEDEEANAICEERLKAYEAKKSKKPALIAKSSVVLDVKPWDDETDLAELEKLVRSIQMDGLLWGVSKLVPVAYNVKKLQIVCVVEDDKVSIEELNEKIEEFEDYVQSVDIAAFNKI